MGGLRASIVVPAYNEERNIAALLGSILSQRISTADLIEIVVVASGCTDGTHGEVDRVGRGDSRIRLLVQPRRLGKVAAINAYLHERDPRADIVIVCSADILLHADCLERLVERFAVERTLGMTGGRPVPNNRRGALLGEVVHLLWELHHERASQAPKLGEIIAVRSALMEPFAEASPVDEASAEALVHSRGFGLRYVPDALVTNHGPDTLGEYFEQRRRINAGHYWLRRASGYEPSTFSWPHVLRLALRHVSLRRPRRTLALAAAALLEVSARVAGRLDLVRGRSHAIWRVSVTARPGLAAAKSLPGASDLTSSDTVRG
jgi:biofilm PGA synthesis N-glycosyltransferase PgaC